MNSQLIERSQFVRPVAVAIAFILSGEMLILLIWELILFLEGILWRKWVWTII